MKSIILLNAAMLTLMILEKEIYWVALFAFLLGASIIFFLSEKYNK